MVAIMDLQLSYHMEIKEEDGRRLATVDLLNVVIMPQGDCGRLRANFLATLDTVRELYPPSHPTPIRLMQLKVYREPDARSFNLYKNCFVVLATWWPMHNGLAEVEMEWRYNQSEVVLSLPRELIETNEIRATIGIVPTHAAEYIHATVDNAELENSISIADWREFGF